MLPALSRHTGSNSEAGRSGCRQQARAYDDVPYTTARRSIFYVVTRAFVEIEKLEMPRDIAIGTLEINGKEDVVKAFSFGFRHVQKVCILVGDVSSNFRNGFYFFFIFRA